VSGALRQLREVQDLGLVTEADYGRAAVGAPEGDCSLGNQSGDVAVEDLGVELEFAGEALHGSCAVEG